MIIVLQVSKVWETLKQCLILKFTAKQGTFGTSKQQQLFLSFNTFLWQGLTGPIGPPGPSGPNGEKVRERVSFN